MKYVFVNQAQQVNKPKNDLPEKFTHFIEIFEYTAFQNFMKQTLYL